MSEAEAVDSEFMSVRKEAPEVSIRRLQALILEVGSAVHASPVGFMHLRGEISEGQFSACGWFQDIHARYLLAIDAKGVRSGSAELTVKSEPPDPYSPAGRRKAKKDREAIAAFRAAELAALSCGRGEFLLFRDVVMEGAPATSPAKRSIKVVSEALRKHRAAASRFRRGKGR